MNRSIKNILSGTKMQLGAGGPTISRVIPQRYIQKVGPFIFLDHLVPAINQPQPNALPGGIGAHPHKGIITFSYLLHGVIEHYDSRGNHGVIQSGGAQWMNAGNGIVHDEMPTLPSKIAGGKVHGFQLWINLPRTKKLEAPEYQAIQSEKILEILLPDEAGKIRVLMGEFEQHKAAVKIYSPLVHLHLIINPGKSYILPTTQNFEYGIYVPEEEVEVNQQPISAEHFVDFYNEGEGITIANKGAQTADVMIYGGMPINEPMVAEGPFVMNHHHEIQEAYQEYFDGKFGEITY